MHLASDHIVLPLRRPLGELPPFFPGIVGLIILSAIALPASWFVKDLNQFFWHWFVLHTAWILPLLVLLSHLKRVRPYDLVIFPSSPRCCVRRGSLLVNSFYASNLFVALTKFVGASLHLGHIFMAGPRRALEERVRATEVLNRYILFGRAGSAPPEPRDLVYLPGRFAHWLLEGGPDAVHLDHERLVLRAIPREASVLFGSLAFFVWMYLFGPIVLVFFGHAISHGVLIGIVGLAGWTYRLEHRPRLLTLLASRKTVVLTERNGAERTIVLDDNPFWPDATSYEGSRTFVNFIDGKRKYVVVDSPGDPEAHGFFAEEIELLGAYLGLPPRPPDRRDWTR